MTVRFNFVGFSWGGGCLFASLNFDNGVFRSADLSTHYTGMYTVKSLSRSLSLLLLQSKPGDLRAQFLSLITKISFGKLSLV